MKFLDNHLVFAGDLNKAPNTLTKENKSLFVNYFNMAVEPYISDEVVSYYKALLYNISDILFMINALQNPGKYWLKPMYVQGKFVDTQEEIGRLLNYNIGDINKNNINSGLRRYFNISVISKIHPNFLYGELVVSFLLAYINLVISFYNKLRKRAKELVMLHNIDDVLAYVPKESFLLFLEIYNYLIKNLKSIRDIKETLNEQFINSLIFNTYMMNLIADILDNEEDLTNYQKYQEMIENNPGFKCDEAFIHRWIEDLENKYFTGMALN